MENYKGIILKALQKVVLEQGYQGVLQNRDIHEQSLTHRLAYHLENSDTFIGYHVDCEYNRHGEDSKINEKGIMFKPDVVIHVRGDDKNNLIMIEAKKYNDSKSEIKREMMRLKKNKDHLSYRYAFLVIFPKEMVTDNSVVEI